MRKVPPVLSEKKWATNFQLQLKMKDDGWVVTTEAATGEEFIVLPINGDHSYTSYEYALQAAQSLAEIDFNYIFT